MKTYVMIPARLQSTRLPQKLLQKIGEKTVLQRTYENLRNAGLLYEDILIAVDDPLLEEEAKRIGALCVMTNVNHTSGTSRLFEAAQKWGVSSKEVIINVQADEPFLPFMALQKIKEIMSSGEDFATLAHPLLNSLEYQNPNSVKVVCDASQGALYFSRASIPYYREQECINKKNIYRHIGIYGYTMESLSWFVNQEACELENIEKLEQLRILYYGKKIKVGLLEEPLPPGIDTLEDLQKAREWIKK